MGHYPAIHNDPQPVQKAGHKRGVGSMQNAFQLERNKINSPRQLIPQSQAQAVMAGASPDRHTDAMSNSIKKNNHRRNVKGSENPLDLNSQQDPTFVRKSPMKVLPTDEIDSLLNNVSFIYCFSFLKNIIQASGKMVRKAIIDLYLNVKIRSQEEISAMNEDAMDREKHKLE